MKISIIMPVYNSETFVKYSIESVLNQSDTDWELIIINDGSTDLTGRVCEEYSKMHQGVKVYHSENAGPADARNLGIQKASGEYCIFLDSDDALESEAIQTLKTAVSKEKYEMVFYGYAHDTYDEFNHLDSQIHTLGPIQFNTNESFKTAYDVLDDKGATHPVWNKMFRTDFLKEKKITFPSGVFISEDFVFNLQAYAVVNHVLILEEVLYHYISRDSGSITTSFRLNKIKDMIKVYELSYQLMENWHPLKVNKIDNEFILNLSVYMNSLYYSDCNLSAQEKNQVILSIVNNEQIKKCVANIQPIGYRNKILTFLLKNRQINLLLSIGKIANNPYLKNKVRA